MGRVLILVTSLLLLLDTGSVLGEGHVEIVIDPKVYVQGEKVTLGEIARIRSRGNNGEELESLLLGNAPAPGKYRVLRKKRIEALLVKMGLREASVTGPERIEVWRKWIEMDGADVAARVKREILMKMPWPGERVEVEVVPPRERIVLPEGSVTMKVEFPAGYEFIGRGSVRVRISVDGRRTKTVWVRTDLRVYKDIVVATRPILRNEILGEGDLEVERRLLASIPRGIFGNIRDVTGMRVKRKINRGSPLFESDLALPAVVKRGSMVTIVAEKGPLLVSTYGKAMEKGHVGKVIRVQNVASKKVIMAEVLDSKTVRITF